MIDWIDAMGKDWGHHMRKNPTSGYPSISIMGRIAEEGPVGASIRSHFQSVPVRDTPRSVLEFHRAWSDLASWPRVLLFVQYVPAVKVKEKLEFMGLKRRRYYYEIDEAHANIFHVMERNLRARDHMQPVVRPH